MLRAPSTSSVPQPVSASRPGGHCAHPVDASSSIALRSSSHETWSGRSVGSWPRMSAAAAATCGAAKDVPIALRNSSGPQSEYGCPVHAGLSSSRFVGIVEKMLSPGAAMSL